MTQPLDPGDRPRESWAAAVRARFEPRAGLCPVCGLPYPSARAALQCWLTHQPNLRAELTLEKIGTGLGITRERVRQLFVRLREPVKRRGRSVSPANLERYTRLVEELGRERPVRSYRTDIPPERRERWRIIARERYRNNPDVQEAAKRRYRERWENDPAFREEHRRRARERYYRLKLQQAAEQSAEA